MTNIEILTNAMNEILDTWTDEQKWQNNGPNADSLRQIQHALWVERFGNVTHIILTPEQVFAFSTKE